MAWLHGQTYTQSPLVFQEFIQSWFISHKLLHSTDRQPEQIFGGQMDRMTLEGEMDTVSSGIGKTSQACRTWQSWESPSVVCG